MTGHQAGKDNDMTNDEMMTLTLRRIDMCDIRMALTSIICEMKTELHDDETSEYRKGVLKNSIAKWDRLRVEVIKQFDEQDEQ